MSKHWLSMKRPVVGLEMVWRCVKHNSKYEIRANTNDFSLRDYPYQIVELGAQQTVGIGPFKRTTREKWIVGKASTEKEALEMWNELNS